MEINDKIVEKIGDALAISFDPQGDKKGTRDAVIKMLNGIADNTELTREQKIEAIQEVKYLAKKMLNRKAILAKASEHLENSANPREISDDWFLAFWDKCGLISDELLQELWGRIFSEEANYPHSVSRRLVHNLSLMSKKDTENFANLARFCFSDGETLHPIVFMRGHQRQYAESRITPAILKELEQFALIEINYESGFAVNHPLLLKYDNHAIAIQIKSDRICLGNVRLTEDGQKLMKVVAKEESSQILEYTVERLQYDGYNVIVT